MDSLNETSTCTYNMYYVVFLHVCQLFDIKNNMFKLNTKNWNVEVKFPE